MKKLVESISIHNLYISKKLLIDINDWQKSLPILRIANQNVKYAHKSKEILNYFLSDEQKIEFFLNKYDGKEHYKITDINKLKNNPTIKSLWYIYNNNEPFKRYIDSSRKFDTPENKSEIINHLERIIVSNLNSQNK